MEMGEFSKLSTTVADHFADRVRSRASIRGRISLRARAWEFFVCSQPSPYSTRRFFATKPAGCFVTVFAYLLDLAGLFWVTMPYLLRDQINWSAKSNARWHIVHGIVALYGAAILACAFTQY